MVDGVADVLWAAEVSVVRESGEQCSLSLEVSIVEVAWQPTILLSPRTLG